MLIEDSGQIRPLIASRTFKLNRNRKACSAHALGIVATVARL